MRLLITFSAFLLSAALYGQNNYSMSFDGVDDYVNLSNCSDEFVFDNGFNISFWARTSIDLDSESFIYFRNNSLPNSPIIYIRHSQYDQNDDEIYVRGTSGEVYEAISIPEQTWFHISLNLDRSTGVDIVKCYIDGVEILEISNGELGVLDFTDCSMINETGLETGVYLGTAPQVNWDYFTGQMDNVQLWAKSNSEEEIQQYMSCPPSGDEEGLVGYWSFEEGSGTTAYDQTTNGNNGTINGATWSTDVPEQSCPTDCTDSVACNYNPDATEDDGSCDYTCCPGPGCCSIGHYWDWELEQCFDINPTDTNLDGCTDLNDLMDILANYGDCAVAEFTCGDDIEHEGYSYSTVQIGDQCWFSENCRYLPEVSPSSEGSETEPYYYVYDYPGTDVAAAQATENYATYGVLYNWPAVMTEGICPSGWHIPSDGEWQTMEISLGMSEVDAASEGWRGAPVGDYLKSTSGWSNNGNGSNSSGFTGLPGGYRYSGGFYYDGSSGSWWSASESGSYSWRRALDGNNDSVYRGYDNRFGGFSARCVRD